MSSPASYYSFPTIPDFALQEIASCLSSSEREKLSLLNTKLHNRIWKGNPLHCPITLQAHFQQIKNPTTQQGVETPHVVTHQELLELIGEYQKAQSKSDACILPKELIPFAQALNLPMPKDSSMSHTHFPKILNLDLSRRPIAENELKVICALCPNVQQLVLFNSPLITDAGLSHLAKMVQMRFLRLILLLNITDAGLAHLAGMVQMQSLSLSGCTKITNTGLAHLAGMTQMQSLNLSTCEGITDAGLAHISGMVQMKSLRLFCCTNITAAGLAHLSKMVKMQILDLANCPNITDAGLAHLSGMVQMRSLDLSNCPMITDAGLAHLTGMAQMESLDLSKCPNITDAGLAHLAGMNHLVYLNLEGCPNITEKELADFAQQHHFERTGPLGRVLRK